DRRVGRDLSGPNILEEGKCDELRCRPAHHLEVEALRRTRALRELEVLRRGKLMRQRIDVDARRRALQIRTAPVAETEVDVELLGEQVGADVLGVPCDPS